MVVGTKKIFRFVILYFVFNTPLLVSATVEHKSGGCPTPNAHIPNCSSKEEHSNDFLFLLCCRAVLDFLKFWGSGLRVAPTKNRIK